MQLRIGQIKELPDGMSVRRRVKWIKQVINYCIENDPFTRWIAAEYKDSPDRLKILFRYAYLSSDFQGDSNVQTLKTPRSLFRGMKGNCVDYSIFISSVLSAWNAPHFLKVTKIIDPMTGNQGLHIYAVTDGGTVIDPVYGKEYKFKKMPENSVFNKEIPYIHSQEHKII